MRTILLVFLLGLFCRNALASSDIELANIVRNAMIERLLDGDSTRLKQETPVEGAFVREIAPERLGSNIVNSAFKVTGTKFEFESSEHDIPQHLSHVVVWIFSYHDNKSAFRNAKSIRSFCKNGNCFKSKILTIFSSTIVENKIVIVFTENSGNENVVSFIKSAPGLFEK
ncbi:MAG: hypothetical protein LBE22_10225 [Azoarcus sp.]|jgi:hypothetical protein|nr:hypothetical protein [Azoarcus sp.]